MWLSKKTPLAGHGAVSTRRTRVRVKRLFLALFPPPDLARRVVRHLEPARAGLPRASWVPAERLHLTLHFFGDRTQSRAEEIATALSASVAEVGAMRLTLQTVGAFGGRRPRVIWVGVAPCRESEGAWAELSLRVRGALQAAEEPVDPRPLRPHLTVARCRGSWARSHVRELRERAAAVDGSIWEVSFACLTTSERRPDGPRYHVAWKLPFAEARG